MTTDALGDVRRRLPAVHLGPLEFDAGVWVYGTVTLMSVLVVYEGWGDLKRPLGVLIVVVGPTIALAMAHVFADVLKHAVERGDTPVPGERRRILAHGLQYLLVGVPPLVVLAVTSLLLRQSAAESIRFMLLFGVLSLGFWGGLAGWRVGYRGWRLVASAVAGLLVGLTVMAFQIVLKPH